MFAFFNKLDKDRVVQNLTGIEVNGLRDQTLQLEHPCVVLEVPRMAQKLAHDVLYAQRPRLPPSQYAEAHPRVSLLLVSVMLELPYKLFVRKRSFELKAIDKSRRLAFQRIQWDANMPKELDEQRFGLLIFAAILASNLRMQAL